ncbi:rRNA adenine N-6-methyltransferase family protein [Aneurinibacillus sp. Ricciae_BoGa-3]|uniref:class I SAM-dependent methyltransferase n=1 Tax=Aneurinibacillus sp. Ricciae_BoGa-3 TaxID=3022697 RepID=UPI002341DA96|nr:rRNA adenine N-6-methyltransferase family protein [Aneurinibacillus sp. Ricciae_BoGa-3]WCK56655.1 rRNA adenine N-6-methyltransferase family protein [Aneurinibacillus sp. Ricciae_BoGa-3]
MIQTYDYIKNMLKDKQVASLMPTSLYGVKKVCSKMDFTQKNVIVEYGPATGVFTDYILSRLCPESRIIVVERNKSFVSVLRQKYKSHQITIYHDSAENILDILNDSGENKATYILSGIPFSFFNDQLRDQIVSVTSEALSKGGKFLCYQTFYQKNNHLKHHMDRHFTQVHDEYCLYNVPPLRIYEGIK